MICLSDLNYDNYLFILTRNEDKEDDRLYLKTIIKYNNYNKLMNEFYAESFMIACEKGTLHINSA